MSTPSGFLRDNYGWLSAGYLLTFTSSFGQTFFISVFAGHIRDEFGLSHAQWGGIYMIATMASAGAMVFAGGVTDRFRVRHVGAGILVGLALAAFSMATATGLVALTLSIFLLRLMGQGMMGHTAMVAMARWFVASRGRAVALAGLGVSTGEALLPITFVALMGVMDWRSLWVLAGGLLLALAPVLWLLLRQERTPQSFAAQPGSDGMQGRSWTRAEVLRHWLFWAMIPAIMGPAAWNTAFFFHQVHFAAAKGLAHVTLVAMFPLWTGTAIVTMLASGWLVDKVGSARLAGFYLLPSALGYLIFQTTGGPLATALGIVSLGASVGAHATISTALWAEFFGTAHLGRIRAMTGAIMVLGTALGPALTGLGIDAGLDFPHQGGLIAAYFVAAALLAGLATARARRLLT